MSTELFTGTIPDETAEAYHSKREYVSSSPLPEMAKSPLHFLKSWTAPMEPTAPMDRGTFFHKLLLEQDIMKYVARPLKEDGSLVRSNSKEYAAFLAQNQGKTPIDPDLFGEAMAVLGSACANGAYTKAFDSSLKECSFYGRHEETGLYIKARIDLLAKDFSFIADAKSTANISRFDQQIFTLGYDVRLVHYAETVKAATGHSIPDSEFYFFPIESSDPYGMKTYRLSTTDVRAARDQWLRWMHEIAICRREDRWPGYSDSIVEAIRPRFAAVAQPIEFEGVG